MSKPQKIIAGMIAFLFVVSNIPTILIVANSDTNLSIPNISIPSFIGNSSPYRVASGRINPNQISYGQEITAMEFSVLESDNQIIMPTGSSILLAENNALSVKTGLILLLINEGQIIQLQASPDIRMPAGRYLIAENEIIPLQESTIENVGVKINETLQYSSQRLVNTSLNRELLKNDRYLKELTNNTELIPEFLIDFVNPKITVAPVNESISNTVELTVQGSVEKDATLFWDSQRISLDEEGNFLITFLLRQEENNYLLNAIDKNGNQTIMELTYYYNKAGQTQNTDLESDCNNKLFGISDNTGLTNNNICNQNNEQIQVLNIENNRISYTEKDKSISIFNITDNRIIHNSTKPIICSKLSPTELGFISNCLVE